MSRFDTIAGIEDKYMDRIKELTAERDCWIDTANMFKSALELIATPRRPDGTYNRCREACEIIARQALEGSK